MSELGVDLIFLGRVALATVLGFIVGWERETQGSAAGDRTHALVAMGAAAFTTISVETFPDDPARLLANIVTGVGFLGGGMIVKEGLTVRGLTTAAGIWAVAAVGLTVGVGEYVNGVVITVLITFVLMWERLPGLSRLGYSQGHRAELARVVREEDEPK